MSAAAEILPVGEGEFTGQFLHLLFGKDREELVGFRCIADFMLGKRGCLRKELAAPVGKEAEQSGEKGGGRKRSLLV